MRNLNSVRECLPAAVLGCLLALPQSASANSCVYIYYWNVGNFTLSETYFATTPDDVPCGPPPRGTNVDFIGGGAEQIAGFPGTRFIGPGYMPNTAVDALEVFGVPDSVFNNRGKLIFQGYGPQVGRPVINYDTWHFQQADALSGESFENRGSFGHLGGGEVEVLLPFTDISSSVFSEVGDLTFTNDDTVFSNTQFSGAGNIRIEGQASFEGTVSVAAETDIVFASSDTFDLSESVGRLTGDGRAFNLAATFVGPGSIDLEFVNESLLMAQGGTLSVSGPSLDNVDGEIDIAGDGHLLLGNSTVLSGGVINAAAGGTIGHRFSAPTSPGSGRVQDTTVQGVLTAKLDRRTGLAGTITNQGTITFEEDSNNTVNSITVETGFEVPEAATLAGGGQVVLNGPLTGFRGAGVLTNADNTIRGEGAIRVETFNNQGTLRPEGGEVTEVVSTSFNNTGGEIDIAADGYLLLGNNTVLSGGVINAAAGGTIGHSFSAPTSPGSGRVQDTTVQGVLTAKLDRRTGLAGTITNQGTITFEQDSNNTVNSIIVETGFEVPEAATLAGGGQVVLTGPLTGFRGAGMLTNADNTIRGEGVIRVETFNNQGTLRPEGLITGVEATLEETSLYQAIINPIDESGKFSLSGQIAVGGGFEVQLTGALPTLGQLFSVIEASGGLSGEFDEFDLSSNTGGQTVEWEFEQSANGATVEAIALGGLQGDYNGNGVVERGDYDVWVATLFSTTDFSADGNLDGVIDAADYAIWEASQGAVVSPLLTGDYNGDGLVTAGDRQVWRNAYGMTVPTPGVGADGNGDGVVNAADYTVWRDALEAAGSHTLAVPEPASLLYAVLALTGLARASRPRVAAQ